MMLSPGDRILQQIYVEIKSIASGGDTEFYLKPMKVEEGRILLEHIHTMKERLSQLKSIQYQLIEMTKKHADAVAGLQDIATSKFPNTAAKADLLQQRAADILQKLS